ncbi:SPFH domain-containing protein [Rhodobaculum claviforme]|uniref:Antifreeze protein n=1 Tax=Rhodobaculum claviforme TaxID=1549854 RepID=A0A934THK7_9RHOB|nr:SPFH domain-containing protein [Rhodobaculum claviforme]MBK5925914.1 antifreeze protein [Rhodobaculum claviforme]
MVFSFLKGQFIDVIAWTDDTRDTMVWRFQRHGNAIMYGAKLTVREGQAAVFVHEGQLADVFSPGLYELETNNMPILTALQHWDHGFSSPFQSEIYFVNTTRFTGMKWGTMNPVMLRDPEFGPTRIRAFGTYAIRVKDPARFMAEIVGTDGAFTTDEITGQIRNILVQKFSRVIAASGIPVLDMAANTADLSRIIGEAIEPTLDDYGLSMPELYIENISLPPAVEAALDKRTSAGLAGDLSRYTQFSAAEAMTRAAAADNPMGGAMGMVMGAQMGPWGAIPQPAQAVPPPPPPADKVWHIAENGQTTGPFGRADLGRMAATGGFGRSTLVWTPGLDGWQPAGEIAELAQLFTVQPPPPPPPPAP